MTVNWLPGENGDAVYHSLDLKTEDIWRHMCSINDARRDLRMLADAAARKSISALHRLSQIGHGDILGGMRRD